MKMTEKVEYAKQKYRKKERENNIQKCDSIHLETIQNIRDIERRVS